MARRNTFISTFLIVLIISLIPAYSQNKTNSADRKPLVMVGTYTQKEPHVDGKAEGIYIYEMNPETGALTYVSTSPKTINPSYVAVHPNKKWAYAVNEIGEGTVSAFNLSNDGRQLSFKNSVSSHGSAPCYVTTDASGKFVLVANYGSGTVALYPVNPDGSLSEATSVDQHTGKGPTSRQEGPHAHMIVPGNNASCIYSADLGTDQIIQYMLDSKARKLNVQKSTSTQSGAGPRHLAFHQTQPWAYVVNELNGTIEAFQVDRVSGDLSHFQTISTLPEGEKRNAACADIHIAPSGKYLYASNRGEINSIAMYTIDLKTGKLNSIGYQPLKGKTPRSFAIDPTGKFMLVANQDSGNVITLKIDPANGKLIETGIDTLVPTPVCLKFF